MGRDITIATSSAYPLLDEDGPLLCRALRNHGFNFKIRVWSDTTAAWGTATETLVRNVWDSHHHPVAFRDWLGRIRPVNGADLVVWGSSKSYLIELLEAGIPVISSRVASTEDDVDTFLRFHSDDRIVVKPEMAGSGWQVKCFSRSDWQGILEHAWRLDQLNVGALIQPLIESIKHEVSLIYISGSYSHSVIRSAACFVEGMLIEDADSDTVMIHSPTEVEMCVGDCVLDYMNLKFGAPPMYARVDLMCSGHGVQVNEVEVVDPALFLTYRPVAADLLAAGIVECR